MFDDLTTYTAEEKRQKIAESNEVFCNMACSNDPVMQKRAADVTSDYTRRYLRESSVSERVLPPQMVGSNDEFDRRVDSREPHIVIDLEPDSPGAISIGYNGAPMQFEMNHDRYRVPFFRIESPLMHVDVDLLRTSKMDVRRIFADNAIKDISTEEDSRFFAGISLITGGVGTVNNVTGSIHNVNFAGGITRENFVESLKVIPSIGPELGTGLGAKVIVVNNISALDFMKFDMIEYGGEGSQENLLKGIQELEYGGRKWITTIKRSLVPTNTMFHFEDPIYMGRSYIVEDTTMFIEQKRHWISFYASKFLGSAIGNPLGIAQVNFPA